MLIGNNYDSYFRQTVIKNCDVVVLNGNNPSTVLLNGRYISSFSMERENTNVPERVPNDTTTIEIKNWSSLPSTTKTYLTTKNNYVIIRFVVENTQTSNGVWQSIKECKVDFKNQSATLSLTSPFLNDEYVTPSFETEQVSRTAKITPYLATRAEAIQQIALCSRKAIRFIDETVNNQPVRTLEKLSFVDYAISLDLPFDNITEEIDYYVDSNDRSNIVASGWTITSLEQLTQELPDEYQPPNGSNMTSTKIIDKQLALTNAYVTRNGQTVDASYNLYANRIVVAEKYGEVSSNYTWKVYGFEPTLDYKGANKVLLCKYLFNDGNLDAYELERIQADVRSFYSNRTYFEFKCRIDPRIEPLDNIYVNGIGVIKVENVTINFNGGFQGKIKGRMVGDLPVLSAVTISSMSAYSFVLSNSNNDDVVAEVHTSDGEVTEIEVPANSTTSVTVTSQDYPSIYNDAVACNHNTLTTNTYIVTSLKAVRSHVATTQTILYYSLVQPVITVNIIEEDNFRVEIKNNNSIPLDLFVDYSSGRLTFNNVPAGVSVVLDNTSAPELENSALEKYDHVLGDVVDCAFSKAVGGYNQITSWVVIWEADD